MWERRPVLMGRVGRHKYWPRMPHSCRLVPPARLYTFPVANGYRQKYGLRSEISQVCTLIRGALSPNRKSIIAGFYMLWLIDTNNLPCKLAPFIRLAF